MVEAAGRWRGLMSVRWLRPLIRLAGWGPLAWLVVSAATDGLGANPTEFVIRDTGSWALIFLCASLSMTPLRVLLALPQLAPYRRMFGLFAFAYAGIHLTAYIAWDQAFDLNDIIKDVIKRPFITMGMASFSGLLLLAATSPKAMVRGMGAVRWKRLHKLVYVVGVLVIVHFWWHKSAKHDLRRPAMYGAVIAASYAARGLIRARGRASRPAIRGGESM